MAVSMAEAAKKLGVSVSLIRRYEREFGLQFTRNEQGRCVLSDQDLTNLTIIRSYRQQNMPIDAIKALLSNRHAVVEADTTTLGPDLREVMAAIVRRQDELEQVVKAQGAAIQQLTADNRRLQEANQHLVLQLEAPREATGLVERVHALEARANTAEEALDAATKDEMMRKLQRRLLDLEAAVATELHPHDEDEGLLDELARAIQAQAVLPTKKWWKFWR